MTTVDQILKQQDNYSQLSIDASFTLQDILQQPPDQQIQIFNNLDQIDNFDEMFQDEMFEDQNQGTQDKIIQEKERQVSKGKSIEGELLKQQSEIPSQKSIVKTVPVLRRWARLQDLPLPPTDQIRNMVYVPLKNVTQLFDIANSLVKGVGVPTCISTSGNKFLAIGTSIGNCVIFEIGVKGHKLLNTPDQNKYGQVTSISISRDNRYLVSGYESGLVILWDLYSFKSIKTILLQKNRIFKVLFCGQGYQNFVSTDSQGYLYMYTVQNYLWTGVKSQLLIDKSQNIYYDLKYSKIKSGKQILALSTFNSVLLISLKPTVSILGSIERPDGISSMKIPNCQIGQGQQIKDQKNLAESSIRKNRQDFVCVSWGKQIYVYRMVDSNVQNQKLELNFIMEQPSAVHNMQFITSGILVTIDSRQVYRVINLHETKLKRKENTNYVQCQYINVTQLETQTIYQRYLKDKEGKFMKVYSNTIVNCSYNPRYKEIFLIAKNAVYRGRLQKWTDYALFLMREQKNWELALKLCIELSKGKYNIFAEPFNLNKTTRNVLCEIGSVFFKDRMKQVESKRQQPNSIKSVQNQARQLFQITIQFFSTIDCEDYMFTNVYTNLKQNYFFAYQPEFIGCLQPFIEQSLINRISNRDIFNRILEYYADKPQLINIFIIALSEDSLHFEDIVQICTTQKLFQSLCYICSINGDFISPANKIIHHLQTNPNDKVQYNNLKAYLNKLIELKYPNGKPITNRRDSMLMDIAVWLGCDQTLQYMVKNYSDDYFDMMSKLVQKLLEFDLVNQIPTLAENVIGKLDIIRPQRLLNKLVDFLVEIGLSPKIHFSRELLKKILDACIEMYDTYKTTEFRKQFKYINILQFLEKYLLQKFDYIIPMKQYYEQTLIPKLNIWVRIVYKMLAEKDRQELLKESPQILKNEDPGRDYSIGYLLQNSHKSKEIINKYEDLIIQWSPEQSLIYILESRGSQGIKQINTNIMKIEDQKLKYVIIRKVLRMLRAKNKQLLAPSADNQVREIVKASLMGLGNPNSQLIANQIIQTSLNDKILLFYMTCICKYKKEKRVFYELTQNQYQYKSIITQLAPIVQKYGYRSCMGYIYEQQLRYVDAFTEYSAVYTEYFYNNFTKLVNHQYCHGRFMARIFHIMLDLCLRIKKQQQWGVLISVILSPLQKKDFTIPHGNAKVIDTIQKIYEIKSSKQHPFMQQLVDVIQLTLTTMSREVSMSLMGLQLNKYTDLLNKSFVVNCLTSTLRGCRKRVETFEISKKLMISEFVTQFEYFFQINKINGSSTDNLCDECQLQANNRNYDPNIEQIRFQVLKCGHAYHEKCFKKNYYKCKICTRKEYGDVIYDQDQSTKDKKPDTKQSKIKKALTINPEKIKVEQQEQKTEQVYRYLAFEDYLHREEEGFENFREQYQGYITSYKQK